jgi:hypothetical protein
MQCTLTHQHTKRERESGPYLSQNATIPGHCDGSNSKVLHGGGIVVATSGVTGAVATAVDGKAVEVESATSSS